MKLTSTKAKDLQYIRAIVYGDSGVGKTTSLRTLPEDRTVIACSERGMVPLRKYNYHVLVIKSWADVRALVAAFVSPDTIEDETTRKAVQSATVLAVDSLSELGELCKRHILTVDRVKLVSERTDRKRTTPEKVYDDLMTQEDWGLYRARMMGFLSALCKLPVHIVCTALATWTEDKKGGGLYRAPGLNGKLAYECPAHFDLVFSMESIDDDEGGKQRAWRTAHDGQTIAKATEELDPWEAPNWTAVFSKIINGGNEKPKAKAKGGA